MKNKDFLELAPVLLMTAAQILTVKVYLFLGSLLPLTSIFALALTIICGALYFVNQRFYRYTLAVTLTLGTCGIVSFLPGGVTVSNATEFLQTTITVEFELFSFCLLTLFLIINRKRLKGLAQSFIEPQPLPPEQREEQLRKEIHYWKNKYNDLPLEELVRLAATSETLFPAAKAAIETLIELKRRS